MGGEETISSSLYINSQALNPSSRHRELSGGFSISGPDPGSFVSVFLWFFDRACNEVQVVVVIGLSFVGSNGAVTGHEGINMFEHDQGIVQQLLADNTDFKTLFDKHQELDEKVDKAGNGELPLDDMTLEKMKKEKLLVKDKMALMIEKHRRAHA